MLTNEHVNTLTRLFLFAAAKVHIYDETAAVVGDFYVVKGALGPIFCLKSGIWAFFPLAFGRHSESDVT